MTTLIKTAADARRAIGDRVEWLDPNGSHRSGKIEQVWQSKVRIDGAWYSRRKIIGLKLHRMYDK